MCLKQLSPLDNEMRSVNRDEKMSFKADSIHSTKQTFRRKIIRDRKKDFQLN